MEKEGAMKDNKSGNIVPVLACVLNQLCVSNDQMPFSPKESNSKFHALRIPAINLKDYLERIAKYSGCSTECLVLALVYIDRIIQGSQNFIVNSYCIHRLIITSVMLAAKFFDDHYYNNAYYAKVGGVTYSEMNGLEVEFLFMLNFDLFVTTETYKQYYDELWSHANSTSAHLCGCVNAKVSPLILPRFDEIRKTPTMLDQSDLSIDQSDLDNIEDSPSPTYEIPSTHCGTKIPSIAMTHSQTHTHISTSSVSKPIPIIPPDPNSAIWHVSPGIKHDRIIAPPVISNKSNGSNIHDIKNSIPFCGNVLNPFIFQDQSHLQPYAQYTQQYSQQYSQPYSQQHYPQQSIPFDVPPIASKSNHKSATQSTLALKGRDDVMLDILIDHNLPHPTTSKKRESSGGLSTYPTMTQQSSMMVESPSLSSSNTQDLGFYGDFPSFLSDTDTFDEDIVEDEEIGHMVDSKGFDISPSFHPYGITRKFYTSHRGNGSGKRNVWKERGASSNRRDSRLSNYSHQGIGHLNHHSSHSSSKRKENNRGDTNIWQSIVLPVY